MVEQGTPEWHQMRLGKVSASRMAELLAKVKSGAPAQLGLSTWLNYFVNE